MSKLLQSEVFCRILATLSIAIFLSIVGFSFKDIVFANLGFHIYMSIEFLRHEQKRKVS